MTYSLTEPITEWLTHWLNQSLTQIQKLHKFMTLVRIIFLPSCSGDSYLFNLVKLLMSSFLWLEQTYIFAFYAAEKYALAATCEFKNCWIDPWMIVMGYFRLKLFTTAQCNMSTLKIPIKHTILTLCCLKQQLKCLKYSQQQTQFVDTSFCLLRGLRKTIKSLANVLENDLTRQHITYNCWHFNECIWFTLRYKLNLYSARK